MLLPSFVPLETSFIQLDYIVRAKLYMLLNQQVSEEPYQWTWEALVRQSTARPLFHIVSGISRSKTFPTRTRNGEEKNKEQVCPPIVGVCNLYEFPFLVDYHQIRIQHNANKLFCNTFFRKLI
ncbi:uncharacterized protein LOC111296968 [Durio zibethinus]|uniref:Uncharacterized protein LOC111296968 n=1 Tax=Durio zibethinus TaxID=66656 RepID=A0A6P5Z377_DURZI|nr:uncharacterized protein LOC111296968 [Durio zibethinus]